ncbi:PA2928 family protein [Umezawaea tangerina]|uniref:Uncharacterized protein n=1 Tax=Umezawaea tangerina TaxID=84725 RepID=A0A2T0SWS0_9PSEU|nr:PA2928 family protein [Umezawaea tangerina]PRY37839.1 hypothetical protein CLV43_10959 [Umezawaea tangerina]
MYQTPQPYTPVAPYEAPRRVRRRFPRFLGVLVPLVFFAFMFFGFSYLASPEPDVHVQPGIAATSVDGHDVVLVPYERHGARGMFQLMAKDMFQVRLAAADPATGAVLWDTQLSDELIWNASVLAAGAKYAYLATDSGLVVVDLHGGAIVAQGDKVTGLGGQFVAAPSAYGYDAASHRVVAMNADGAVLAIPLDDLVAAPADQATAAAWAGALSTRTSLPTTPSTAAKAALGSDGRIELRERPGAPGGVLVRVAADGTETPAGVTVFHGAAIVLDGGNAAGSASGHVLVRHKRSVNDTGTALSAVSLATGVVTGSLDVTSAPDRAVTLPGGSTAVAAGDQVVALGADGRVTALHIGATDFFGSPS